MDMGGDRFSATRARVLLGLTGIASLCVVTTISFLNAAPKPAEAPDDFAPILTDWPDTRPDVVLVLTGEMHGYMRPCGCSPGQHGGLARRGGFLAFLREKEWPTLPIELGDLVDKAGPIETLRYDYILESLTKLGYPVIGVGVKDLGLSILEVAGRGLNSDPSLLVGANLRHRDPDFQLALEKAVKPAILVERGGVKIAVSSVIGANQEAGLPEKAVKLAPTDEVVRNILHSMRKHNPELKVLLAHMPMADAEELARKFPGFDLILCSSRIDDSDGDEAKIVGDTMVTWVGRKGKSVGVVGYWREGKPKLRFDIVPLDLRYKEDETMNDIYARFVQTIKREEFLKNLPRTPFGDQHEFVGAESCKECHEAIYDHWKETKHFHALETLEIRATPAGQDYNPECVKCHVVGLGHTTGFMTPDTTRHLGGVQCENCHGPGKKHVESEGDRKMLTPQTTNLKEIERRCITCHDTDNSLHFKFEEYWPKVRHPDDSR